MLTSVHLITGAGLGAVTGDVYVAAVASFVVHYALDAIPHFSFRPVKSSKKSSWRTVNFKDFVLKSIEPLLGIGFVLYFVSRQTNYDIALAMVSGAIFGFLPDLLVFLEWKWGIRRPKPIRLIENASHRHNYGTFGVLTNVFAGLPFVIYLAVSYLSS